jgi:hypothetical protein
MTLVICHKSLRSILSPFDLWDPSPSDLWDPTAYVSHIPVGPFSIRPMGPDGLCVTCACGPFSIRLVGPDDTFLLLHPTYGTWWLACHMSDLWDPITPFSISIRPVGLDVLRVTCGPFLHPTCGTRQLVCHLWTLSPSNLWDLIAYMSRVPMGPFSISIRSMGPDNLCWW